ncbi:MAG: PA14 domain-containing protein, partial [Gemmatimonadaceae bacterium]
AGGACARSTASGGATVGSGAPPAAGGWRPAPAPLFTPWAAGVSPTSALPEYPRPQLVRPRWRSLNGLWEFASADGDAEQPPFGRALRGRILVPYPVESALSGVGKHHERVWYRRTFEVPAGWGERVLLHFGAVDYEATVYVNGKRLAVHRGGYDAFTVDVTDALRPGGEGTPQELVVGVHDPTDRGDQPRGRQVERPHAIWHTAVTGIWQTVWLEPVPAARVLRLRMTPDVAARALRLVVSVAGARMGDTVEAVALVGDSVVGRVAGKPEAELSLVVRRPRLWSPEDPFLYDLGVTLRRDGETVDSVASYFGLRSVSLGRDGRGGRRVLLDGQPFFGVGPLDQGYWPDGLYTAPTDAALRADLEITKRLGFTMVRKHAKVEPERWYYWADRLGLAVWQDMPGGRNRTSAARSQFEVELRNMIEQRGNHPSIVAWVPFDEGWGEYDASGVVDFVRGLDESRLVDDASGWRHDRAGDLLDVHRHEGPQALLRSPERATAVGAFGGLAMVVPGHAWAGDSGPGSGGEGTYRSADSLAARYELLLGRLWRDHAVHGTSAGVYAQLTDVEGEVDGLLTYDRRVLKIDTARVVAANVGLTPHILPEYRELTSSATVTISSGAPAVRYTTDGSEPTADSRRYRGPFVVRGDTVAVRARAFAGDAPMSPAVSAEFRRVAGREPDSVARVVPGVRLALFRDSSLRALTLVAARPAGPDTIAALLDSAQRDLSLPVRRGRERFAVRFTGYLRAPRDGVYALTARADDGVRVWVGDRLVVDGMGFSPSLAESRGEIALRAGLHPVTVTYFQSWDEAALQLWVDAPGGARRRMDDMLYRAAPAEPAEEDRSGEPARGGNPRRARPRPR